MGADALSDTAAGLDRIFRAEHGRFVSTRTRLLGSLDLAEEAAQEAYVVAARTWPGSGVPPNPGAWLTTTARRRAIDRIRRESRRDAKQQEATMLAGPESDLRPLDPSSGVADDRLRMIFTCCHPALDLASQVALCLKVLGGLSTAEVAAAFLVAEPAMAKRLTRTKTKIAAAKIPYRVPADADLPSRVRGVLATLFLIYNEGYLPGGSPAQDATRPELTGEAIRLARLVVALMPDEPEAIGLLALMLLIDARRPARVVAERIVAERIVAGRGAGRRRPRRTNGRWSWPPTRPSGPHWHNVTRASPADCLDEIRDVDSLSLNPDVRGRDSAHVGVEGVRRAGPCAAHRRPAAHRAARQTPTLSWRDPSW